MAQRYRLNALIAAKALKEKRDVSDIAGAVTSLLGITTARLILICEESIYQEGIRFNQGLLAAYFRVNVQGLYDPSSDTLFRCGIKKDHNENWINLPEM